MTAVIPYISRRLISSAGPAFPPLEIRGLTDIRTKSGPPSVPIERKKPHHLRYGEHIDWTNIWPAAATFNYSVVPIPLRQGYAKNHTENSGVSPASYANTELMKIPNFLHLTKLHIRKQCEALKKFCTAWPSGLDCDEVIAKHYPVEVVQRSYIFSAHSIRDPRARIATIQVPVNRLGLDDHAKRKLLRLTMGPGPGRKIAHYDWDTNILQMTSGRCPTWQQNLDYLKYVLTVLTMESRKTESWEEGHPDYDWMLFDWSHSSAKERLLQNFVASSNQDVGAIAAELDKNPLVKEYRKALEAIWSENDVLHGDQWVEPPKQPRYRHNPYPQIKRPLLKPVPGADKDEVLCQYANATRRLLGLDTTQPPN